MNETKSENALEHVLAELKQLSERIDGLEAKSGKTSINQQRRVSQSLMTEHRSDTLPLVMEAINQVSSVISDYEENKISIAKSCSNVGVDYIRFLRVCNKIAYIDAEPAPITKVRGITEYDLASNEEKLYADVFCVSISEARDMMPDDENAAIESALATLTVREQSVIRSRVDGKTLNEIANQFCVTRERVRQIEARALRKLRHRSRQSILLYGKEVVSEAIAEFEKEREELKREYKEKLKSLMPEKEMPDIPSSVTDLTIECLEPSVRAYNILKKAKINTVGELLNTDYATLWNLPNMGRKTMEEILSKLSDFGLTIENTKE